MAKPNKLPLSPCRLACHGMMGSALGVLCAGLLLVVAAPLLTPAVVGAPGTAERLIYLLTVAMPFGVGAVFTGAVFLIFEEAEAHDGKPERSKPNDAARLAPVRVERERPARRKAEPDDARRTRRNMTWSLGVLALIIMALMIGPVLVRLSAGFGFDRTATASAASRRAPPAQQRSSADELRQNRMTQSLRCWPSDCGSVR